ncbi:hypothetical protein PtB15_13B529 [Puccinia triticina]|nr:hypothetical protein PtB15_13B529 [Puccinia triticina]
MAPLRPSGSFVGSERRGARKAVVRVRTPVRAIRISAPTQDHIHIRGLVSRDLIGLERRPGPERFQGGKKHVWLLVDPRLADVPKANDPNDP